MANADTPLFELDKDKKAKSSGPPNRMNDLAYRDWMKFQKSFFTHQSLSELAAECIHFFTKTTWPDGAESRSLIIGFDNFDVQTIPPPRVVDAFMPSGFDALTGYLNRLAQEQQKYDFVLVNLLYLLVDVATLTDFLDSYADSLFASIRQLLHSMRYCGFVVDGSGAGGVGFPLPWSVAVAGRDHLRLRDEKIGLVESTGTTYYCHFFQANEDQNHGESVTPAGIDVTQESPSIPAWLIPKPPPRKPNEVLHPAKFPETLIGNFIKLFTKPGDGVFDPMMGTGSTVIAALRLNRNAYGTDLNPEFVEITRQRIQSEQTPTLFQEMRLSTHSLVTVGDATQLNEIAALAPLTFHYCVTSPPYWSMLTNPGGENQKKRREQNLRLTYSDSEHDLGNVAAYGEFLDLLTRVYNQVADKLVDGGHLTVVVKNVKRDHIIYALAWDITARLCGPSGRYAYVGNTFWCQDDVPLKPFAVGIHWVSNTLHHYCLHFRKRN